VVGRGLVTGRDGLCGKDEVEDAVGKSRVQHGLKVVPG
jgi:hypothetical protein